MAKSLSEALPQLRQMRQQQQLNELWTWDRMDLGRLYAELVKHEAPLNITRIILINKCVLELARLDLAIAPPSVHLDVTVEQHGF